MGVRGLTTYIANRSDRYLEYYELSNSYVVIDGNSICCQLYIYHCKCNDCFGGDYDKFRNTIYNFFETLSLCKVTPLVIYDGGYEKRKLRTVMDRIKTRIKNADNLNSVTEGTFSSFPLFRQELFKDVVSKLKIKCVQCEFEGDGAIASVAKVLNCPVLSYDSDFFIFDVLYIPFPTLDINPRSRYNQQQKVAQHYMVCKIYRIDNFLKSFGGIDRSNLPLLAVLLGNDYMKRGEFGAFYKQLKLQKSNFRQSDQQRRIKSVIMWFKNETFDSAFQKILSRFKSTRRKKLIERIQEAVSAYTTIHSDILRYLQLEVAVPTKPINLNFSVSDEELRTVIEDSSENGSNSGSDNSESDTDSELPEFDSPDQNLSQLGQYFTEKFKRCVYPACFMDIITLNCYYFIVQVEESSRTCSHNISLDILSAIHKILRGPHTKPLTYYCRSEHSHVKKYSLALYDGGLPSLLETEKLKASESRRVFLEVLKIDDGSIIKNISSFPKAWHLYVISLNYWIVNRKSDTKISNAFIYAFILCGIVLLYVDEQINFCRSSKVFFSKYRQRIEELLKVKPGQTVCTSTDISELVKTIDYTNSLLCMKQLISYFQMDAKMRTNLKLYDKTVVHELAEFQSCLYHIRFLNLLLNNPYPDCSVGDLYDGTFIYNMVVNLRKRNISSYLKTLLMDCPNILGILQLFVDKIMEGRVDEGGSEKPGQRRRKRKKRRTQPISSEESSEDECSDDTVYDKNNRFSVLTLADR